MIISVAEVKKQIDCKGWTDGKIARKLKAIEKAIRKYTNNNFQDRGYRSTADIVGGLLVLHSVVPFSKGDTVQISETQFNKDVFSVEWAADTTMGVSGTVIDEKGVLVTKITYPEDVIDCALNLFEWDLNNRQKVGIKSETLSRHSVTYEDSSSMFLGYPVGILNALNIHKKARF